MQHTSMFEALFNRVRSDIVGPEVNHIFQPTELAVL